MARQLIINRFTIPMKDCGNRKIVLGLWVGTVYMVRPLFFAQCFYETKTSLKLGSVG